MAKSSPLYTLYLGCAFSNCLAKSLMFPTYLYYIVPLVKVRQVVNLVTNDNAHRQMVETSKCNSKRRNILHKQSYKYTCRVGTRMDDRGGCRFFSKISHGSYTAEVEFIDISIVITGMHR
jgi:hypothetical protein